MTDQDKERIEKAAENSLKNEEHRDYFKIGAEYEHPIAFNKGKIEGFNEGIEAALTLIKEFSGDSIYPIEDTLLEEIEKLKK
jgi:hypothetical protein